MSKRTLHILNTEVVRIIEESGLPVPIAGICGSLVYPPFGAHPKGKPCRKCTRLWKKFAPGEGLPNRLVRE